MFYRGFVFFIVLFWFTMTGLLIHQEMHPGDSALSEVPPAHVMKLLFMHHEETHLHIYSEKLRLGQIYLDPQPPQGDERNLAFKGDLQILMFGSKREHIKWEGLFQMDKLLNIQQFHLSLITHYPTELTTEVVVVPKDNIAHFKITAPNGASEKQDFTLDERGLRSALQQVGVDPALLPIAMKQEATTKFDIKARQSSLALHGARMDTYLVTVESNGQTLLECHVDQLGRVVRATTLLGYTLAPEDVTP